MHCPVNPIGREVRIVPTALQTLNLPRQKILDKRGNPLNVSAIVVYKIVNTKRAALDVEDYHKFILLQATATLKQVVSRYPYEADAGQEGKVACLKTEAEQIGKELKESLQDLISQAVGASIADMCASDRVLSLTQPTNYIFSRGLTA